MSAFLALLQDMSYSSITVQDILDRSGYSRGSFYSNFRDKDDLLRHTFDTEVTLCVKENVAFIPGYKSKHYQSRNTDSKKADMENHVYSILVKYYEHVYHSRSFFKLLYEKKMPGYSLLDFGSAVYEGLKEHYRLKSVTPCEGIDEDLYTYFCAHEIVTFISYWAENNFKYSPQYMAEQIFKIVMPLIPGFSAMMAE